MPAHRTVPLLGASCVLVALVACGSSSAPEASVSGDGSADAAAADAADEGASSDDGTVMDAPARGDGGGTGDASAPDGSVDASADGGPLCTDAGVPVTDAGACSSTLAVLAASSTAIAQAVSTGGVWSPTNAVSQGVTGEPALAAYGAGYLGVFAGSVPASGLVWTQYAGSWSAPASVAGLAPPPQGHPALGVLASAAHVAYWGANDDEYYQAIFDGSSWSAAAAPGNAGAKIYGLAAPAAAALGPTFVLAFVDGNSGAVMSQTWNGSWAPEVDVTKSQEASVQLSPAIAALSGGGADAMIVYQGSTSASLRYTVRAGGSWSAPADLTGSPSTSLAPAVAPLPGGGAVAVWQGAKGYPYASVYDGATWSAPVVIAPAAVKSRPTVAAGVCGATAVAALTSASGGPVALSMLTACGWSAPAPVAGTAGMPYAEVASAP